MNKRPKLGRPYGSKTFREPYGVRYARRYLELWAGEGMSPTAAAKKVAAEWGVAEADVFHAYKRHMERLCPDMDKALRVNYVWFGRWLIRHHPDVADAFARQFIMEFQSGLDKLTTKLDSLGCTVGAQGVRAYDPASALTGDKWLAILGQIYLDFLKPRSNKKPIR